MPFQYSFREVNYQYIVGLFNEIAYFPQIKVLLEHFITVTLYYIPYAWPHLWRHMLWVSRRAAWGRTNVNDRLAPIADVGNQLFLTIIRCQLILKSG